MVEPGVEWPVLPACIAVFGLTVVHDHAEPHRVGKLMAVAEAVALVTPINVAAASIFSRMQRAHTLAKTASNSAPRA